MDLTFGTGSWHRYRVLPSLRRGTANHRLYRGSALHSDDPRSPEDKRQNLQTLPVTRKPRAAWSAVWLTPSSSFNPGCRSLEAHGREPAGRSRDLARTPYCRGRLWRRTIPEWSGIPGGERCSVPPPSVDNQLPFPEKGVLPKHVDAANAGPLNW